MLSIGCKGPHALYVEREQAALEKVEALQVENIRLKSVHPALHAKIQQLTRQLTDARIVCEEAQAHRDALEKNLHDAENTATSCNQRHLHEVQALASQVQTLTSELQRLTEENGGLRAIALRSAYAKDSCEDKVLAAMSHLSMSDVEARHFLQELAGAKLRAAQAEADLAASQEAAEQLGRQATSRLEQCQVLMGENKRMLGAMEALQQRHDALMQQQQQQQQQQGQKKKAQGVQHRADDTSSPDRPEGSKAQRPPWSDPTAKPQGGCSDPAALHSTPTPAAAGGSRGSGSGGTRRQAATARGVAALQAVLGRREGVRLPTTEPLPPPHHGSGQ